MSTELLEKPDVTENSGDESEVCHSVCITDPDTALCGTYVGNDQWEWESNVEPLYCKVCEELEDEIQCPICKEIH